MEQATVVNRVKPQFMVVLRRLADNIQREAVREGDGLVEVAELEVHEKLSCIELTWTPRDHVDDEKTVWRMFAGGFHNHTSLVKLEHGDFDTDEKKTIFVSMSSDTILAIVSYF